MSEILQETEDLCSEILKTLEGISADVLGEERVNEIKARVEGVKNSVSKSKKKVMVRTEEGKKLSMKAKSEALELENVLRKLQKNPSSAVAEKLPELVMVHLNQLEKEVSKVETYWRSYEAAIT